MTDNKELWTLIKKAEALGATVSIGYDLDALVEEGRSVISTVQVADLKGCGPFPMSPIAAAERLRELAASIAL